MRISEHSIKDDRLVLTANSRRSSVPKMPCLSLLARMVSAEVLTTAQGLSDVYVRIELNTNTPTNNTTHSTSDTELYTHSNIFAKCYFDTKLKSYTNTNTVAITNHHIHII